MGTRQILKMHIVPDTCTIWGRIIAAKDIYAITLSERNFQHIRYNVRLRIMILTQFINCTTGIEIPEKCRTKSFCLLKPKAHLLEH